MCLKDTYCQFALSTLKCALKIPGSTLKVHFHFEQALKIFEVSQFTTQKSCSSKLAAEVVSLTVNSVLCVNLHDDLVKTTIFCQAVLKMIVARNVNQMSIRIKTFLMIQSPALFNKIFECRHPCLFM